MMRHTIYQYRAQARPLVSSFESDGWIWWLNTLLALSLLPYTNVWGFYG